MCRPPKTSACGCIYIKPRLDANKLLLHIDVWLSLTLSLSLYLSFYLSLSLLLSLSLSLSLSKPLVYLHWVAFVSEIQWGGIVKTDQKQKPGGLSSSRHKTWRTILGVWKSLIKTSFICLCMYLSIYLSISILPGNLGLPSLSFNNS